MPLSRPLRRQITLKIIKKIKDDTMQINRKNSEVLFKPRYDFRLLLATSVFTMHIYKRFLAFPALHVSHSCKGFYAFFTTLSLMSISQFWIAGFRRRKKDKKVTILIISSSAPLTSLRIFRIPLPSGLILRLAVYWTSDVKQLIHGSWQPFLNTCSDRKLSLNILLLIYHEQKINQSFPLYRTPLHPPCPFFFFWEYPLFVEVLPPSV